MQILRLLPLLTNLAAHPALRAEMLKSHADLLLMTTTAATACVCLCLCLCLCVSLLR
jgi:hypothetical protein